MTCKKNVLSMFHSKEEVVFKKWKSTKTKDMHLNVANVTVWRQISESMFQVDLLVWGRLRAQC